MLNQGWREGGGNYFRVPSVTGKNNAWRVGVEVGRDIVLRTELLHKQNPTRRRYGVHCQSYSLSGSGGDRTVELLLTEAGEGVPGHMLLISCFQGKWQGACR